MSAQEHAVYGFAGCELDVRERRLFAHGHAVTLTPKVFDTLVLLVEHAGHVVSKDELMAALWPRGYVHESNLTKHIWLIRHALGDGGDDTRYIETVPKLGYRFVAPVEQVADTGAPVERVDHQGRNGADGSRAVKGMIPAVADAQVVVQAGRDDRILVRSPHAIPAGQMLAATSPDTNALRTSRLPWLLVVTLALVALGGGVYWWRTVHTQPRAPGLHDAGAVAIVDFNNLSGSARDAWLGPALEQMLATELAANGKLQAVSEELVRPARVDLPAPGAGGYAPGSLAALQRRLGAHYVLSGAYLVSGASDVSRVRVDLIVQDAQTGKMLATISRTAAVSDLPNLVGQVGGELRGRFGEAPSSTAVLTRIAAAQPPSAEVARRVGFALQALHAYDPARARDELLQAIAQSPGYAPAYLHLSRAWIMLGYRAKAIAAAKQAAQYAADLPREQQLQIRAWQVALTGDAVQVSSIQGQLVALRPHDPEFRLQWIGALTAAAKYDAARKALVDARKLPALADDPRLELAAAHLALARDDYVAMVRHARRALGQARQRGETGLVAEAELRSGIALERDPNAEPFLRSAIADYHRIDNPHGEALAWQNLGNLQGWLNRVADERASYQRAMTIYQAIGDLGGQAAMYDNLANVLWQAGDRDGTEAALRQALAIARETDDKVRQAWTLAGLATVLSDESASDEVAAMYREAVALDRQTGTRDHLAFALAMHADVLRMRGELDQAREACAQAQAAQKVLGSTTQDVAVGLECAQIALDRGDVDAVVVAVKTVESRSIAARNTFGSANAQGLLGQIAMGRKQWSEARDMMQKSMQGWAAMKETPAVATNTALLALCADAVHDTATRDRLAAQARALRASVTARAEVFTLDVALAELRGAAGQRQQALASLRQLAADAGKRHWVGLAFEARLAEWHVLKRGGHAAAIEAARAQLAADAQRGGYGWVVQRLAMVVPPVHDHPHH